METQRRYGRWRRTYAHGDDGVNFDFDTSLFGPLRDFEYIVDVSLSGPVFCATLFDVGLCVERITGYGHDVKVLAVCIQPFLSHLRAVVHNGTRLDMKFFFTEFEDLPDIARLEKGFSAADVELLHPSIGKHAKSTLGIFKGENKLIRVSVEAKVALVVTTPVWKPVDRHWYLCRCRVEERNRQVKPGEFHVKIRGWWLVMEQEKGGRGKERGRIEFQTL